MNREQFDAYKAQVPGCLIAFRLGDFYEFFYDDAKLAAKIIGLTVTSRRDVAMSGFPYHSLNCYLAHVVAAGQRIAVSEWQHADATRLDPVEFIAE